MWKEMGNFKSKSWKMGSGRKKRKFRQWWSGNHECRAGFPAPTTVGRTLHCSHLLVRFPSTIIELILNIIQLSGLSIKMAQINQFGHSFPWQLLCFNFIQVHDRDFSDGRAFNGHIWICVLKKNGQPIFLPASVSSRVLVQKKEQDGCCVRHGKSYQGSHFQKCTRDHCRQLSIVRSLGWSTTNRFKTALLNQCHIWLWVWHVMEWVMVWL